MVAPGWLTTEPEPKLKIPARVRPGWSPRPGPSVKLVRGWEVPESMGAGQGHLVDDAGHPNSSLADSGPALAALDGGRDTVDNSNLDTQATEPTQNLTPGDSPATVSPEADQSSSLSAAPVNRGVLSDSEPATQTVARAGDVSGASVPPPQGPSSATRQTRSAETQSTRAPGDPLRDWQQPQQPAQNEIGGSPSARVTTAARSNASPDQASFVQQNLAAAKKVSEETGIPYQVLLAIPGNETGWGKAQVGNNYFGIKGKNPTTGASSGQVGTWEVIDGKRVDVQDEFRAYSGYEDSARDFAAFIKDNPRYSTALNYLKKQPDDWRGFVREVHAAGYATDPEWSNKIVSIGNGIGDDERPAAMTPQQQNKLPADRSGRMGVQSVIDVGSQAIGSKYVWGGAGGRTNFDPNFVGSDCSGFVAWAYQQATGKRLTAYTGAIWNETTGVDPQDAAPGDLVMYNMNQGDPHEQHVGVYAGNGMMLHDSSINPNGGVDITPLWKGAQFRRVPVDSNLANYSTRDAGRDKPAPDDQISSWYVMVHGGRQIFVGSTAAGNTITKDMGPAESGMSTGRVVGFSGQNEVGAGIDDGNGTYVQPEALAMQPIGSGQEDETDYSFLDTPLSPDGEIAYQIWKRKYAPKDSGWDYDLRGAFTSGLKPDSATGHWPDTYKKPNHPTFSDQSKYARDYPGRAGTWNGDQYVPAGPPMRQNEIGAGQDAGDGVYDLETLERLRTEEETRLAEQARQDEENRQKEEEARRLQSLMDQPFAPDLPDSPNLIRPAPDPAPNPVKEKIQDINKDLARPVDAFGEEMQKPPEQVAGDLGASASSMLGGIGEAAGNLAGGIGEAVGGAFSALGTNVQEGISTPAEPYRPPVEADLTQGLPSPEQIGETAGQVGETVGDVFSSVGTAARGVADVVGPAAEALNQAQPGKGLVEAVQSPEFQGGVKVLNNIVGAVNPMTSYQTLAPGMREIIEWNKANGFPNPDTMAMLNQPAPPPTPLEPGSPLARAAQGQMLQPGDQLGLLKQVGQTGPGAAWESYQAVEELRRQAIKQSMSPEMRDSPEGIAATEAIVMATDPTNILGTEFGGAAKVGRKLMVEGGESVLRESPRGVAAVRAAMEGETEATPRIAAVIKKIEQNSEAAATEAARRTAPRGAPTAALLDEATPFSPVARAVPVGTPEEVQAAAETARLGKAAQLEKAANYLGTEAVMTSRGTPEEIAFGDVVTEALDRPYTLKEALHILQTAAVHLNDKALEESSNALKLLNAAGNKHEPLTGEQIRRVVINAASRNADVLEPDNTKFVLDQVDQIMNKAGHPLLATDAVQAHYPMPVEIMNSRVGWWETDAARKAKAYEEQRKLAFAAMDKYQQNAVLKGIRDAAGLVAPHLLRGGIGAGLGIAHEVGTTSADEDVNYGRVLLKAGVTALAIDIGAPWASGLVAKGVNKFLIDGAARYLAPVSRFTKPVRDATEEWTGNLDLAHQVGKQLKSEWISVFGKEISPEEQAAFEINGRFSDKMMARSGAEEAVEHWKEITAWAKDQGLIERPINVSGTHGNPKVYIPHILEKQYAEGLEMAGKNKQRGMLSRNPMRYFNQERKNWTMYDGLFDPKYGTPEGFTYSNLMGEHLGNYYERAVQAAAHRLYVQRLHELSLQRTPDLLAKLADTELKADDLVRATNPRNTPKHGIKLDSVTGFEYFPELKDVYVSPDMRKALNTIMGGDSSIRDNPLGNAVMDANAMFKMNVLGGIDAYHIINEMRQLFATQGWNSVIGGRGAGLQVAAGMAGATAGAVQELSQEHPDYARAGVKAAAGFAAGTFATVPGKYFPGKFLPEPMQGGGSLWLAFAHALDPAMHQQWLRDPFIAKRLQQQIRDGMQMTIVPDLPEHLSIKQRFGLAALNTVAGGVGSYQAALMGGASQEDAAKAGGLGALGGLGLSMPVFGKEQRSIVEHLASRTFDQLIPFMKFTTYEMYAPKFGGRAAAEFANEAFGGQNILAIGRSRMVQDVMRLAVLAPDWQEGWARLVGNGLFSWGADKPVGQMARIYWRNALVQSAILLEGMNLAVNGTWSWQNDPNGTMMVKANNYFDLMGFGRTNPRSGEQYSPYFDILGPYRGMLEPAIESSRWVMAQAYDKLGFRPERIPFYDETVGRTPYKGMPNQPIPTPRNPKDAWGPFLSSRGGVLGSAFSEILAGKDFAGNPIDRADDQMYHQASNRVVNFMLNMLPTGQAEISRAIAQGEDPRIAVGSVLTGSRPRRIDSATEHFQTIEEIKRAADISDEEYRVKRQQDYAHNVEIDKNIDSILSGRTNKKGETLGAGQVSDATPTDRKNRVAEKGADRHSMREALYDLAAQVAGPQRAHVEQMIQAQQEQEIVPGRDVDADLNLQQHPNLDPDELFRLAWNRDPDQVAWLKGQLPDQTPGDLKTEAGQHDVLNVVTNGIRETLGRIPGGKDKSQQLQDLRTRWTVKTAMDWGVDPAVMSDIVKAKVYEMGMPPPLPGVKSNQLDDLTDQYQAEGQTHEGKNIADPAMAAMYQQEWLLKTARDLQLDPKALQQRIQLRSLPAVDESSEALGYSHARDVLNDARLYKFQNPDGSPYGTPAKWKDWQTQFSAKRAGFDYVEHDGERIYFKGVNRERNVELTDAYTAMKTALANKYKDVRASDHAQDFYRWYGDGANMTDAQWQQYKDGTLDMWRDKPSPREAQNRREAMRVWASLTPEEQKTYGAEAAGQKPITWEANLDGRPQRQRTALWNYIQYMNRYRQDTYKLGDIDPLYLDAVSSLEG